MANIYTNIYMYTNLAHFPLDLSHFLDVLVISQMRDHQKSAIVREGNELFSNYIFNVNDKV